MPARKRSLVEMYEKGLGKDTGAERGLLALRSLTSQSVLVEVWKVAVALKTLFRHLPALGTTQVSLFAHLLAAFMVRRLARGRVVRRFEGQSTSMSVELYESIIHAENPLVQRDRNSLDRCVEMLHVHPVYKDAADPFFIQFVEWWRRESAQADRRALVVTSLIVLVVRSKKLVQYLLARPGRLVENPSSLTWLYTDLAVHGVKIGLEDSSKSAWSRATQEQRNWSIGFIIDRLVVPYWADVKFYDDLLDAGNLQDWVRALQAVPLIGSKFIFNHTMEYLILADQGRVFNVRADVNDISGFVDLGKNAEVFVSMVNATGQRGSRQGVTLASLCKRVAALLPECIDLETGETEVVRGCVEIDGQQNACMVVHCLQCFLTGKAKGRERAEKAKYQWQPKRRLRGKCSSG